MPDSPQDLHKKLLGKKGERLVVRYIKKRGMRVLHTNLRTPFGEADVIAQDKDEIVFIEVKARTSSSFGTPREAVGKVKQERYYKIAQWYGAQHGEEPNARFDVAEMNENDEITYFENAF